MNSGSGAGLANLRRPPWLIFYTVAMFVLATVGFGANTKFIQMTYIDYRNFPGGPNAFTGAFYSHPINMASFVRWVHQVLPRRRCIMADIPSYPFGLPS